MYDVNAYFMIFAGDYADMMSTVVLSPATWSKKLWILKVEPIILLSRYRCLVETYCRYTLVFFYLTNPRSSIRLLHFNKPSSEELPKRSKD